MQAVRQHKYGSTEVLVFDNVPRPEPEEGELLVRVRAAGLNPVDWKVREGYLREMLALRLPFTPGYDIAGTVEAIGPGVETFNPGDEIYAFVSLSRAGAYAEYAIVKIGEAAVKPRTLSFNQAAAVPLAALTAWQALFDVAHLISGQRLLVHAAAGGVGHFAVQLATWAGAHVIGTASADNLEFLRRIGAHQAVDYAAAPFAKFVDPVDVVLDTIAGDTRERSWPLINRDGFLVSTLPPEPEVPPAAAAKGIRAAQMLVRPNGGQLVEIAELIDSGHLQPEITVLPFSEVRMAHELSQHGHTRGKIVLAMEPRH